MKEQAIELIEESSIENSRSRKVIEVNDNQRSFLRDTLMESLFHDPEAALITGVVIGEIVEMSNTGHLLVDFNRNPRKRPLPTRSLIAVDECSLGDQVALVFENGDPLLPILIGRIHAPQMITTKALKRDRNGIGELQDIRVDGERVRIDAKEEIVLNCGEASITLTKAGKILLRGRYLLSRSSGVNQIKGGSVHIN